MGLTSWLGTSVHLGCMLENLRRPRGGETGISEKERMMEKLKPKQIGTSDKSRRRRSLIFLVRLPNNGTSD